MIPTKDRVLCSYCNVRHIARIGAVSCALCAVSKARTIGRTTGRYHLMMQPKMRLMRMNSQGTIQCVAMGTKIEYLIKCSRPPVRGRFWIDLNVEPATPFPPTGYMRFPELRREFVTKWRSESLAR